MFSHPDEDTLLISATADEDRPHEGLWELNSKNLEKIEQYLCLPTNVYCESTSLPPTTQPNTSEPSRSPSTSEPSTKPSTSEPSRKPNTSEPSTKPNTSEPSRNPSTASPSLSPSTTNPTMRPTTHEEYILSLPSKLTCQQNKIIYDAYLIEQRKSLK